VGVAANALTASLDRGATGVPFHAILRRILTSASFEEAVGAVVSPVRASSANYLIASGDGRAADLETAPGGREAVARFDGDRLAHANHFLAPPGGDGARGKDLEGLDPSSSSVARQAAAEAVASAADPTIDELLAALADHDAPVCQHAAPDAPPAEAYETIAAVAMDLTEGALWITDGPPCTTAAERSDLPSLVARAG
jgi:isopenicillin-N N-acyltransferase-like protein